MTIADQLRGGVRDIDLPADLILADGEIIACQKLLRILPHKRAVMQARWHGKSVLVKLMPDTASGARTVRREKRGWKILQTANIATPKLLRVARCADKSHVLIFEFLRGAQSLGELWKVEKKDKQDKQDKQGAQVAATGIAVIAALHRSGCIHTDPHLDNFLVANQKVYVIDVASIKRRPKSPVFNRGWRRRNLALFIALFLPAWQRRLCEMLARHYREAANDNRLTAEIMRVRRRRSARYLKKCFRDCSDFAVHRSWRKRAAWRRDLQSDALNAFIQTPQKLMRSGARIKNSAHIVRAKLGGRQVVIMRDNNIAKRWKYFRPTAAHRNWRNAHLLLTAGIATPTPIAYIETRFGPLRFGGYYLCEFNPAPSLRTLPFAKAPKSIAKPIAKSIGALFEAMRLAQICHSELKSRNLLVGADGICVIGLQSVKQCTARNIAAYLRIDRETLLADCDAQIRQLLAAATVDFE